jgi:hypothetical protein
MDTERNNKSKILKIIFWIATIGCFVFGYYNTHLGLRTFNAFGSGSGSWFLAAIPLVMVFGGYIASVQGKKTMLALYLTGEIIFFVFNLTYLYPQYLGRALVTEEANILKDSLNAYQNKIDNKVLITGDEARQLKELKVAQEMLLEEIKERDGFGPRATEQLNIINRIAGTNYTPDRTVGRTQEERDKKYKRWKDITDKVIDDFSTSLIKDKDAVKWVEIRNKIDGISHEYKDKLDIVIQDKSDVNIEHDAVNNNPQIKMMVQLTKDLDDVADAANSTVPYSFNKIVTGKETIPFPKTQQLGTFQHTMISVRDRFNKLDTWGVLIVCFFFDLLGPFLFYFYLREEDDDDNIKGDEGIFDGRPWFKRILGID